MRPILTSYDNSTIFKIFLINFLSRHMFYVLRKTIYFGRRFIGPLDLTSRFIPLYMRASLLLNNAAFREICIVKCVYETESDDISRFLHWFIKSSMMLELK
jgi:hypothetical protein